MKTRILPRQRPSIRTSIKIYCIPGRMVLSSRQLSNIHFIIIFFAKIYPYPLSIRRIPKIEKIICIFSNHKLDKIYLKNPFLVSPGI